MKKIAIIGSGVVGLLAAHGLLKAGYTVTVYSDRTAEQWLTESRPTGTAARFDMALSYERELGLNYWEDVAPKGEGINLIFCPEVKNQLLTLNGRFSQPFMAIDVRLQSHRWLNEFEARGGKLVIESVSVARLDEIAAENDLTIVASGRSEISNLFARDAERSVYDTPQRHLAMLVVKGAKMQLDGFPFSSVKFNFVGTEGEAFWVPYYHKDCGPTWNIIFEAKPGKRMDRFAEAKSGEEVLRICKEVIKDLFPWDYAWVKNLALADPNGWLVGRFAPMVRQPVGTLPSGRVVTPLGDTRISHDPIAGQGANTGQKMARHMVASIVAQGERQLDAAWMTQTADDFFEQYGRYSYGFTNLLLEPLTPAGQEVLIAQYGSTGSLDKSPGRQAIAPGRQAIANAFCDNFNDPRAITHIFQDVDKARAFISQKTGQSWLWTAVAGRASIMVNQLRQKISPPVYALD